MIKLQGDDSLERVSRALGHSLAPNQADLVQCVCDLLEFLDLTLLHNKLDGVAPLLTDHPMTSSTTLSDLNFEFMEYIYFFYRRHLTPDT